MSFIGSIKSFIDKSAQVVTNTLGITKSAEKSDKKKPVIEGKGNAPVDTVNLGNSNPQKVSKTNLKALQKTIEISCDKNGINKEELFTAIVNMLNLKDIKEFKRLPEEKQAMFLGFIGATIKRAEERAAQSNKHVDITKIVIVDIKLAIDAINKKALEVSDISELETNKDLKKSSNNFLENINSLTDEEMDAAIDELESKIQAYFDAERAKIDKITDSKLKAKEIKRLQAKVEYMRNQIYNEVLMGADNEHAVDAISIVESKNLPNAAKDLFATRKNANERQNAADLYKFEKVQNKIVKRYYEKGDELSIENFGDFTTEIISHMSANAAAAYRNDYVQARAEYEKTGYPEFMKKEMFTQTAASIISGMEKNEFMTAEEKAYAIKDLYKQEEQFGDVESVKQKVGDEKSISIDENKKEEQQKDVSKELQERVEREIFISPKPKAKNEDVKAQKTVTNSIKSESLKEDTDNYSKAVSKTKIEFVLSNTGFAPKDVAAAFKVTESKVYKVIFSKDNLIDRYEQDAINYITHQKKVDDLLDLAMSPKAIELILNHARVDNREELDAKLEKKASSIQKHLFKEEKKEIKANAANK
ncbi:hypothetical protein IKQ21_01230 [bacterium]|nr:hypothetical protein [bacterium]